MKYGYMFYQKPLIPDMQSRPINLGDPIQSYAVKLLYKEMGIKDEDIIPIPRYDMKNYNGEECICVINSASNYEELAYDSNFMPPSDKIHPIPMSLHIQRNIPDDELEFYKSCGGVGCRDALTCKYLNDLGVKTYLSGCLTLTFPKRSEDVAKKADKVYIIDVQDEFLDIIPGEIKNNATIISNLHRFQTVEKPHIR